ncbi:hypothetical protein CSAL01_13320 [Colletotrichum salicis]|uniref:Uncharacterized protein n=1 Tax=Colletotrichum salicis TaxID=1209931 RepID=A0A135V1E8_9PEZI|nr:hypothetical protein CSAL01_13320 [Colletotrichum salicis]
MFGSSAYSRNVATINSWRTAGLRGRAYCYGQLVKMAAREAVSKLAEAAIRKLDDLLKSSGPEDTQLGAHDDYRSQKQHQVVRPK